MAAHQAPPSLFSRKEPWWNGLPFPSTMRESEVAQSCPTPSDSMDCSLPGSSIHGIFQARVLEWGAIAFSLSEAYPDLFKFGTILLTSGVPNFPTLFLAKTFIILKIITSLIIFMHLFILFLPF